MLLMLPNYTLERLQETDIDLLFPLYFWYCRQSGGEKNTAPRGEKVVYRGGKPYVVKKADQVKVF